MSDNMVMNDEDMANFFNFDFDGNEEATPEETGTNSTNEFSFEDLDDEDGVVDEDEESTEDDEEEFEEGDEEEEFDDEDLNEVQQFTETFTQKWELIDDDHVFDFGNIQLTKADLQDAATAREEHKQLRASLENYASQFGAMNQQTDAAFQAARTETEGYLITLREKLKRGEFQGEAKARAYEDIERLEARKAKIDEAATNASNVHKQREAKMDELRLNLVDKEMNKRYGAAWGKQIAPQVVQYAASQGIDQGVLVKNVSPALLEVLIKASKFDSLQKGSTEKVKRAMKSTAKAPTKSKSPSTRTTYKGARMTKAQAYERAKAAGDSAALFNMLDD